MQPNTFGYTPAVKEVSFGNVEVSSIARKTFTFTPKPERKFGINTMLASLSQLLDLWERDNGGNFGCKQKKNCEGMTEGCTIFKMRV